MTTDKIFFQKIFRRGGKWQRGENDRGYYGNLLFLSKNRTRIWAGGDMSHE